MFFFLFVAVGVFGGFGCMATNTDGVLQRAVGPNVP